MRQYSLAFATFRALPRPRTTFRASARWLCTAHNPDEKHIVFLGTLSCAVDTLDTLIERLPEQNARIVGVVTRPPAKQGRSRTLKRSPVHEIAEQRAVPSILTPRNAKGADFLETLAQLRPHLCITAAYGCILPQKLLDIPTHGTLNIHPSLLPLYRGAAPVPRFLLDGGTKTGVSVAWTVLALDAGPILTQTIADVHPDETAPELLDRLFALGAEALLDVLPSVWAGNPPRMPQDDALATHAAKLSKDNARISFYEFAQRVHNRVRALTGWPGKWGDFEVDGSNDTLRLKLLRTSVLRHEAGMCFGVHDVTYDNKHDSLRVTCDDGSVIGVHQVQPPAPSESPASLNNPSNRL